MTLLEFIDRHPDGCMFAYCVLLGWALLMAIVSIDVLRAWRKR